MRLLAWVLAAVIMGLTLLSQGFGGVPASSASPPISSTPPASSEPERPVTGEIVFPANITGSGEDYYPAVLSYVPGYYYYEERFGYLTARDGVVLDKQYVEASFFSSGLAAVREYSEEWDREVSYYINTKGEPQFGTIFAGARGFSGGYAITWGFDGACRIIDIENSAVYELEDENVRLWGRYSDGMIGASFELEGDLDGYFDVFGNVAIEPQFVWCTHFHDGMAMALLPGEEKVVYINTQGEIVLRPDWLYYDDLYGPHAYDFSEGLACAKTGYINKKGEMVITFPQEWYYESEYDGEIYPPRVGRFSEGLAVVSLPAGGIAVINKAGKVVFTSPYDVLSIDEYQSEFSDGRLVVVDNREGVEQELGTIGYIDTTGKLVIGFKYATAFMVSSDFINGIAEIAYYDEEGGQDRHGYIDKKGKLVYVPEIPEEDGVVELS